MGYTTFTTDLIRRHLSNVKSIIDLGSQNLYLDGENNERPPFVSEWYRNQGIEYDCIDLAGDNGAIKVDLSKPIDLKKEYDLVVDAGTSEHVVQMKDYNTVPFHDGYINSIYPNEVESIEAGFYNCWLNKFKLCKIGGLIISENPKTENWPDHGYSYISPEFYNKLCMMSGCTILQFGEHPACGNVKDGWNVFAVLQKTYRSFPDYDMFRQLPIFRQ